MGDAFGWMINHALWVGAFLLIWIVLSQVFLRTYRRLKVHSHKFWAFVWALGLTAVAYNWRYISPQLHSAANLTRWLVPTLVFLFYSFITFVLYGRRSSSSVHGFWFIWGDRPWHNDFSQSVVALIKATPLLIWFILLGSLVSIIINISTTLASTTTLFISPIITLVAALFVLAFLSPTILMLLEKQTDHYHGRLTSAQDKIRMVFEFEKQGKFDQGAIQLVAQQSRDDFLSHAEDIEKRLRDTRSLTFDEGRCDSLARFAKRHLKTMSEVNNNKAQKISELLYAYHRYEWDILTLIRQTPKPTEEPETEEVPQNPIEQEKETLRSEAEREIQIRAFKRELAIKIAKHEEELRNLPDPGQMSRASKYKADLTSEAEMVELIKTASEKYGIPEERAKEIARKHFSNEPWHKP